MMASIGKTLSVALLPALTFAAGCGSIRNAEDEDPGAPEGTPDAGGSVGGGPAAADGGPEDESDAGPDASSQRIWFVSASSGDDGNDGSTPESAFRTITHALGFAASGEVVQVGPGTYDLASGETIPIAVPDGVTLRGNEANKGADVVIAGTGVFGTTVDPRSGSVLAGLTLRSANDEVGTFVLDIVSPGVTVQNCTIADEPDYAIYARGGTGHVLRGNLLVRNASALVILDGVGVRVEGNIIRDNSAGVRHGSLGGDLGGGAAGSTGGNVLACNGARDFETYLDRSASIAAASNAWDHLPPSTSDIINPYGAAIDLTGATLASDPCP